VNKSGNEKDKADIIASEKKLQDLGFVEFVNDLPTQQQEMLRNSSIQNFIPWRAVWKPSSISTPCRIVFDASQPTPSGYSLNDILAKGTNNLNTRCITLLGLTLVTGTSNDTFGKTNLTPPRFRKKKSSRP